ncbi:MAG: hypothetical protein NT070_02715 [Cyanobacteria bacterium]|nr:hypothetical protein [Cyanobacteriota bacterium]
MAKDLLQHPKPIADRPSPHPKHRSACHWGMRSAHRLSWAILSSIIDLLGNKLKKPRKSIWVKVSRLLTLSPWNLYWVTVSAILIVITQQV